MPWYTVDNCAWNVKSLYCRWNILCFNPSYPYQLYRRNLCIWRMRYDWQNLEPNTGGLSYVSLTQLMAIVRHMISNIIQTECNVVCGRERVMALVMSRINMFKATVVIKNNNLYLEEKTWYIQNVAMMMIGWSLEIEQQQWWWRRQ